nr:glutamate-rich protein 2 isoform X12 [Chrysemys picta bellii]
MNRCNAVWGPGTPRTTTPKVSGMLEVVGPDDGFILEACLTMSRQNCLERTGAIKDQKNGQNGRLHVFGPKEEVIIEPIQTMPCMCRRTGEYSQHGWGTNQHGFGPESTNKVYTPTKQISLCAAKSTFEKWDASAKTIKKKNSSRIQETNLRSPQYIQETTVLIYEPENTEAKQFLPLLEEKLLIESTQNFDDEEGEETDEGSSEDSEEDTSSSDSSDDEGEESSGDSDENV